MSGKSALVFLAEGAEEMETVIVVDVLRRAKIDVKLVSLDDNLLVECSRQVKITADCSLKEVQSQIFDAVILPGGGKGAENLRNSSQVGEILKKHQENDKMLAAVCAAPTAFQAHDIGKGTIHKPRGQLEGLKSSKKVVQKKLKSSKTVAKRSKKSSQKVVKK